MVLEKINQEAKIPIKVIIIPKCTRRPLNKIGILPESPNLRVLGKLKPLGSFQGPTTK